MQAEPAAIPVMPPSAANPTTSPLVEPQDEFEFSDIVAMSCFLCARQFKSSEQLHRHNTESDLHKARSIPTAPTNRLTSLLCVWNSLAMNRRISGIPVFRILLVRRRSRNVMLKKHQALNSRNIEIGHRRDGYCSSNQTHPCPRIRQRRREGSLKGHQHRLAPLPLPQILAPMTAM